MNETESKVYFVGMCLFADLNTTDVEGGVHALLMRAPGHTPYLIYKTSELEEESKPRDPRIFLPPRPHRGALAVVPLDGLSLKIDAGNGYPPELRQLNDGPGHVPSLGEVEPFSQDKRLRVNSEAVATRIDLHRGRLAAEGATESEVRFLNAWGKNQSDSPKHLAAYGSLTASSLVILGPGKTHRMFKPGSRLAITNVPAFDDQDPNSSLSHFVNYYRLCDWPDRPIDADLRRPYFVKSPATVFHIGDGEAMSLFGTLNSGFCPTGQHP